MYYFKFGGLFSYNSDPAPPPPPGLGSGAAVLRCNEKPEYDLVQVADSAGLSVAGDA